MEYTRFPGAADEPIALARRLISRARGKRPPAVEINSVSANAAGPFIGVS